MNLFSSDLLDLSSKKVSEAYFLAESKHYGQVRKFNGKPYITHPVAVAVLISQLSKDEEMVIASLLHDVIEDTDAEIDEITNRFDIRVSNIVSELTIDRKEKEKIGKRQYLVNKLNNLTSDALTIKLVDRLHNISDLNIESTTKGFAKWYWKETKYLLEHIDRTLNKEQIVLINLINALLDYIKVLYNFNYPVIAE